MIVDVGCNHRLSMTDLCHLPKQIVSDRIALLSKWRSLYSAVEGAGASGAGAGAGAGAGVGTSTGFSIGTVLVVEVVVSVLRSITVEGPPWLNA